MSGTNDGKWIQTFTGRAFWPLSPRAEDVDIRDIAHALAMKCRYTGHVRDFYSVAQHSVIASYNVPALNRMWALMHDATEAYLPDVARPVKRDLADFIEIEDRLMGEIAARFGLSLPMPAEINRIDMIMLATERRDLMSEPPFPWQLIEGVAPLPYRIRTWTPDVAERKFLARFYELGGVA